MSQLKLTADSGGGTVAIKGPASTTGNGAIELTVPGTGNATLLTSATSTGKILQVVSTNVTSTSSVSLANVSLADTPATVTITSTAANSKFLISASISGEGSVEDHNIGFVLRRVIGGSGSSINVGGSAGSRTPVTFVHSLGFHGDDQSSTPSTSILAPYLDSPSQAAGTAITYKIAVMGLGTTGYFYFGYTGGNSDNSNNERTPNYITVQEVAA